MRRCLQKISGNGKSHDFDNHADLGQRLHPQYQKEWIKGPIMINLMKIMPAKTLMKQLIKLSPKFLEYETPENKAYGISFYETVASDLQYKKRFIHSYTCVFMLRNCEYFKKEDFAYLHGKVQILVPEHDIFKKRTRKSWQPCSVTSTPE